jgi:hypothetical protein
MGLVEKGKKKVRKREREREGGREVVRTQSSKLEVGMTMRH